jgi:hypothetical protein
LGIATAVTWSRLPMVVLVPVGLVLAIITIAMVASIASTYLMARKGLNVNIADDMRLSD